MTAEREYHIIGRGLAGWHADGVNVRSSGGDIEPRTWWTDGHIIPPYQASAVEGAPVYDASEADVGAYSRFVISGPMVDAKLAGDGWSPLGGVYDPDGPRALDYVGVERYIALLREDVPGVRYGRVHGDEIVWEVSS